MCRKWGYAALYGVALGTLTLLLIFFGHRVNAQLSAGIDLLKELELVESTGRVVAVALVPPW